MSTTTPTTEVRLKRFLYTSNEQPKFITGDADFHKAYTQENAKVVSEILQSNNPDLLLNIIQIVNSENLTPRRETLFFVLALATTLTIDPVLKHKIYTTFLNLIKSSEDIFKFLKFYTKQQKKFGSALNKVIGAYYFKKDPVALAEEVIKSKGMHSWTHKDLIKLSHSKCDSFLTRVVITYVLHGLIKAKLVAEGNETANEIITLLSNATELKRCENEKRVVELLKQLHCNNLVQVPSFFHRSPAVWEALIPELSISDLILNLPRLYRLGFLKANSVVQTKVVEALTNTDTIKASEIHPVEIFVGIKNFEKGGKPMDPKLKLHLDAKESKEDAPKSSETAKEVTKCPPVMTALYKAMQSSFQNISSTGRRILVGIEISKKMDSPCLTSKNVTCFDAATILILSLLKSERDVTVAVFNGSKISIVSLDKNATMGQAQSKLKQAKSGLVMFTPLFDWTINKKKQIDVFINFFHHQWLAALPKDCRDSEKSLHMLNVYRKKMSLPHTKLISFSLSAPHVPSSTLVDGSPNVLDISGFSKEVPRVIEAFSKGLFY